MNIKRLRKVQAKLKKMRHKKHFNMGVFHTRTECGTAACIAGHVLILEGYSPTLDSCQFIKNGEKVFADEGKRKNFLD